MTVQNSCDIGKQVKKHDIFNRRYKPCKYEEGGSVMIAMSESIFERILTLSGNQIPMITAFLDTLSDEKASRTSILYLGKFVC